MNDNHDDKNQEYSEYADALAEGQFKVFYQAQYNHVTHMLTGAEALVRRILPDGTVILPGKFVPAFEKAGLITQLDLCVAEEVCRFIRDCLEHQIHVVPISINLSRHDVYTEGFIDRLTELRERYGVPADTLRVEITESVASAGKDEAVKVVEKLHHYGFVVELDDFGSGYSSLNILKDIDYDIMKLDMRFLDEDLNGRGGTIVSSMVRMAKWLKMPVIAEGVETIEQADFLRSIGCDYIQGYLYSRPTPEDRFRQLLADSGIGITAPSLQLLSTVNPVSFWSEKSLDTLIFNNYVGGACIFSRMKDGKIEFLRVNRKYTLELGMNMTEKDVICSDLQPVMSEEDYALFQKTLDRAIATEEEQECETWREVMSSCCGTDRLCIRSSILLIGKSEDEHIFYATIRNITAEKKKFSEGQLYERSFKNVAEQANIYYWEYNIATKEMHPCYRCMRDLGLPPVVKNYPEPAIEQGIFPPDYADMYRDWIRQLEKGVGTLEGVIPLTVGRVPFIVRYTTEFDEFGRPIKAFGSATLVVN